MDVEPSIPRGVKTKTAPGAKTGGECCERDGGSLSKLELELLPRNEADQADRRLWRIADGAEKQKVL